MSHAKEWVTDEAYINAQDRESSWSHESDWGKVAANKFVEFGRVLSETGQLFHDDVVADFGGNDGYASYQFYLAHAIKPLVIDCEPKRIDYAWRTYGLSTYEAFIEDMSALADKSVTWGFSSHTLEHARDPEAALREMARVISKGCMFVLPIESEGHAEHNHAHSIQCGSLRTWKEFIERNGWDVVRASRPCRQECWIMARPAA